MYLFYHLGGEVTELAGFHKKLFGRNGQMAGATALWVHFTEMCKLRFEGCSLRN